VAPGVPAGWPYGAMPVLCLLSLISRNSPKQLGMVSPELLPLCPPSSSDLDERPLCIEYVTEPDDPFGQIKLFLPARRRPAVERSLEAGDAQRQWLQARLPEFHQPQCPFSPRLPRVRPSS